MKNVAKKAKLPLFVIQHTNTAAERSSAYLTSLGVDHQLVAPRVAA